uniref:Helicase ATP-binding domain-containing protein n=1 Tax=Astyanax mexicanus TaxID=7994 RepID=A0A3B1J8I8_ASTMX
RDLHDNLKGPLQKHYLYTEEENPDDVLEALLCNKKLFSELYPHQRDGILFLYNAYKNGKSKVEGSRNGVILADEMGLGKSIQVILFLHFMIMNTHKWKNALLVMPAGLLSDWKGKLENWTPDITVLIYQNSEKELLRKLRRLQKTGGILLVSYNMFIKHHQTHTTYKGMPFIWDCLVFDEAHKLKNTATKNHKVAASISAGFHILMTGTPIQNNLKEYWSLVSLISDTCLLGTYKTFKNNFENPITKGMAADSGPEERALGIELQKALEKITEPILLRRRKDQIQDPSDHTPSEAGLCLPKKHEYVVWIKLSPEQEVAYRNIVDKSPVLTFQSIHYLIPVCTHPRFNTMAQKARDVHLAESGKLAFMLALLETLTANGSFVLVFSNYIKILEIIQKALTQTPWGRNAFLRIDGQNPTQRDKIVNRFQKKRRENILLLTTSVGAEGKVDLVTYQKRTLQKTLPQTHLCPV